MSKRKPRKRVLKPVYAFTPQEMKESLLALKREGLVDYLQVGDDYIIQLLNPVTGKPLVFPQVEG